MLNFASLACSCAWQLQACGSNNLAIFKHSRQSRRAGARDSEAGASAIRPQAAASTGGDDCLSWTFVNETRHGYFAFTFPALSRLVLYIPCSSSFHIYFDSIVGSTSSYPILEALAALRHHPASRHIRKGSKCVPRCDTIEYVLPAAHIGIIAVAFLGYALFWRRVFCIMLLTLIGIACLPRFPCLVLTKKSLPVVTCLRPNTNCPTDNHDSVFL